MARGDTAHQVKLIKKLARQGQCTTAYVYLDALVRRHHVPRKIKPATRRTLKRAIVACIKRRRLAR